MGQVCPLIRKGFSQRFNFRFPLFISGFMVEPSQANSWQLEREEGVDPSQYTVRQLIYIHTDNIFIIERTRQHKYRELVKNKLGLFSVHSFKHDLNILQNCTNI